MTLKQISVKFGISVSTLTRRYKAGADIKEMLKAPRFKKPSVPKPQKRDIINPTVHPTVCKCPYDLFPDIVRSFNEQAAGQIFACFDCKLKCEGKCKGYDADPPNNCADMLNVLTHFKTSGLSKTQSLRALKHYCVGIKMNAVSSVSSFLKRNATRWSDLGGDKM